MFFIDFNGDVGEGAGFDSQIIPYLSSANIACGEHAGDVQTMEVTAHLALNHGLALGAHPGYPDRKNYGRTSMQMSEGELFECVFSQIVRLRRIVSDLGGGLSHVKPHGALYNEAAINPQIASVIARVVYQIDPLLKLYGLSGGVLLSEGRKIGLQTVSEVFADRTYQQDGRLTPRTSPNALIGNLDESIAQVMEMISSGFVRTVGGGLIAVQAETLCIHGDFPEAPLRAQVLRNALSRNRVEVKRP